MENFEVLDISGDVGIKAYGATLKEAFITASVGMYSLITDLNVIKEEKKIDVSVEKDSLEGLLVSWLNELIFYFDTYGFIGKRILAELTPSSAFPPQRGGTDRAETFKLEATIYGEEFDPERHEGKLLIKAATYHQLKVEKKDDRWEINVIFDI